MFFGLLFSKSLGHAKRSSSPSPGGGPAGASPGQRAAAGAGRVEEHQLPAVADERAVEAGARAGRRPAHRRRPGGGRVHCVLAARDARTAAVRGPLGQPADTRGALGECIGNCNVRNFVVNLRHESRKLYF